MVREWKEKDRNEDGYAGGGVTVDDVLLPTPAAAAFFVRIPGMAEDGFNSVTVTVDREDAVSGVEKQIAAMGFRTFSLAEFVDTVRLNVLLVSVATAFVAVVALIVAAIGITNTMIMSVLERTHEIGILKALGARDGHIRLIFVVEGVLMGFIGSGIGDPGLAGVIPGRLDRPEHHGAADASTRQGHTVRLPPLARRGRAGPGLPDHDAGDAVSGPPAARSIR